LARCLCIRNFFWKFISLKKLFLKTLLLEKEGKKEHPIFFLPQRGTLRAEKRKKKAGLSL